MEPHSDWCRIANKQYSLADYKARLAESGARLDQRSNWEIWFGVIFVIGLISSPSLISQTIKSQNEAENLPIIAKAKHKPKPNTEIQELNSAIQKSLIERLKNLKFTKSTQAEH